MAELIDSIKSSSPLVGGTLAIGALVVASLCLKVRRQ